MTKEIRKNGRPATRTEIKAEILDLVMWSRRNARIDGIDGEINLGMLVDDSFSTVESDFLWETTLGELIDALDE